MKLTYLHLTLTREVILYPPQRGIKHRKTFTLVIPLR